MKNAVAAITLLTAAFFADNASAVVIIESEGFSPTIQSNGNDEATRFEFGLAVSDAYFADPFAEAGTYLIDPTTDDPIYNNWNWNRTNPGRLEDNIFSASYAFNDTGNLPFAPSIPNLIENPFAGGGSDSSFSLDMATEPTMLAILAGSLNMISASDSQVSVNFASGGTYSGFAAWDGPACNPRCEVTGTYSVSFVDDAEYFGTVPVPPTLPLILGGLLAAGVIRRTRVSGK